MYLTTTSFVRTHLAPKRLASCHWPRRRLPLTRELQTRAISISSDGSSTRCWSVIPACSVQRASTLDVGLTRQMPLSFVMLGVCAAECGLEFVSPTGCS